MKIIKQVDQIGWAAIGKEYAKLRDMHKKLEHDQTEAKKKEVDMQMAEQLRHIKGMEFMLDRIMRGLKGYKL